MGLFGFIGSKRHLLEVRAATVAAAIRLATVEASQRRAEADKDSAEQRANAAQAETARIVAAHATRIRICSFPCDPKAMTAKVRAVEGSLRCEWDGYHVVCYGNRPLTEAEFNAVVAVMLPQMDRT